MTTEQRPQDGDIDDHGRHYLCGKWRTVSEIHAMAEYSVVETLCSHGPLSRYDIARRSGLAEINAKRAIDACLADGRIATAGDDRFYVPQANPFPALPTPQIRLRTPPDVDEAILRWEANCGPTAIAAVTGRRMSDVLSAVPPMGTSRFKGYMNVLDIQNALRWLDVRIARSWSKPPNSLLLTDMDRGPALFMLQWGGPWMRDPRAAAQHRHVIGFHYGWVGPNLGDRWVADVNTPNVWGLLALWTRRVLPALLPAHGDGTWSIGWACAIDPGMPPTK